MDLSSANRNQPASKPVLMKFEELKKAEEQVHTRRSSTSNENCPEITPEQDVAADMNGEEINRLATLENTNGVDPDCQLVIPKEKLILVLAEQGKTPNV